MKHNWSLLDISNRRARRAVMFAVVPLAYVVVMFFVFLTQILETGSSLAACVAVNAVESWVELRTEHRDMIQRVKDVWNA